MSPIFNEEGIIQSDGKPIKMTFDNHLAGRGCTYKDKIILMRYHWNTLFGRLLVSVIVLRMVILPLQSELNSKP